MKFDITGKVVFHPQCNVNARDTFRFDTKPTQRSDPLHLLRSTFSSLRRVTPLLTQFSPSQIIWAICSTIKKVHFFRLDRRIHNYKYRDEFNRDLVSYELRWDKDDLARSGQEINSPERKETFKTVKSKRSHRIDQLRKQLEAAPKTPNVTEI